MMLAFEERFDQLYLVFVTIKWRPILFLLGPSATYGVEVRCISKTPF